MTRDKNQNATTSSAFDESSTDEKPVDPRRLLPSVDALLANAEHQIKVWGHKQVTDAIRLRLSDLRSTKSQHHVSDYSANKILSHISISLTSRNETTLKQIINMSGTVLHTNLGRAVMPRRAIAAVMQVASAPTNLEYDLETGGRGERDDHVEPLICELTGAEAATVVNNNAAAVLLVLNTLANNAQVPVSRGELVEIGGSFRIPEVMQRAGCELVEIGATNRTHLKDYQAAIGDNTALLMKVHTSNYRVEGFTKEVSETELATLAKQYDLPLVNDLGSGNLVDFSSLGLPDEATAATSIRNGSDIITFSGDKLLGGPQCGIIAGRKYLIEKIRKNPLKRALRLDKMTLAALAEVLRLYRNPESLLHELPTLKFLTRTVGDLEEQAIRLRLKLEIALPGHYQVECGSCFSQIGSGALPVENIPSFGIFITAFDDSHIRHLATCLRQLNRPVIGRINAGKLWLDLRCLDCEDSFIEQLPDLTNLLQPGNHQSNIKTKQHQ